MDRRRAAASLDSGADEREIGLAEHHLHAAAEHAGRREGEGAGPDGPFTGRKRCVRGILRLENPSGVGLKVWLKMTLAPL